jgi:hypothetical protein
LDALNAIGGPEYSQTPMQPARTTLVHPTRSFVAGLDPQQELDFTMPTGNWYRTPTIGPKDLMLPSELEKGKYPMWATFRVPGPNGGIVESDKDAYEVP